MLFRSVKSIVNYVTKKQLELKFTEDEKIFDPEDVYGDAPNPTIL